MTTARTIIRRSMQKAGILSKNETPTADEANDALDTLNDVLAALFNEELMNYINLVENFTLTSGVASYTVGVGGTFNTSRPIFIKSGYVREGTTDYELENISEDSYDTLGVKTTLGTPFCFTYNGNNPLGTITFYPVPSTNSNVYLRMMKPKTALTLDTDFDMPPGWNLYITHQMAVLLAPEYGVQCPPEIEAIAKTAKEVLEITAAKNRPMDFPCNGEETDIYRGYT